jgi:hypothetical protein
MHKKSIGKISDFPYIFCQIRFKLGTLRRNVFKVYDDERLISTEQKEMKDHYCN